MKTPDAATEDGSTIDSVADGGRSSVGSTPGPAAATDARCPEKSQEGARCIHYAGHDGKHFAKDFLSYYSWETRDVERRWLAERFLFWIATRAEIAAFALTKRRRGGYAR